jgi:UDP-3-O-[3-hydroxymyristoyl] glucosamine N-acyltransferase
MDLTLPTTAAKLAQFYNAELVGDGDRPVCALSPLESAGAGSLTFLADKKLGPKLGSLSGAVLLTRRDIADLINNNLTFILVDDPQMAFAKVARTLVAKPCSQGVSLNASIDPTAILNEGVSVGPNAVIGRNVRIGAGTFIGALAYLGNEVTIGEQCEIFPNVTLLDRTRIGNRVRILPGSVIGSDGFGILPRDGAYLEMPQIGNVIIEDDVRIGALCSIDRGTLGSTRIGAGSKLDDHIHIGHNCQVGEKALLCAQVGLGGSTTLKERVTLAGQVGIADHVVLGKGVMMGAQSGTSVDIPEGEAFFGSPAIPMKEALRLIRQQRNLPEMAKRLRALEKAQKGETSE